MQQQRWIAAIAMTGLFAAVGGYCLAGQDKMSGSMMSAGDKMFAKKAAQGGITEVKLGELAQKNASSQAIKDLGAKMVTDHSAANDKLKTIAAGKHLMLPTTMNAEQKAIYAKLAKLHGAAFDSTYAKDMREDHTQDVAEFSKEANNGKDPDIKGFAMETLPTIKEHLSMWMNTGKGHMKMHRRIHRIRSIKATNM